MGSVSVALQCVPRLGSRANPIDTLTDAARTVPDPYHRGRALVALAPLLDPAARQALLQEARGTAAQVADPFQQTRLREILIPQGGESDRASLIDEAVAVARRIPDPSSAVAPWHGWRGGRQASRAGRCGGPPSTPPPALTNKVAPTRSACWRRCCPRRTALCAVSGTPS